MRLILALAATAGAVWLAMPAMTTPASAHENCYEVIGCPHRDLFSRSDLRQLSCQNLWYVRNRVYDDHGYCFTTPRAIREFDNSDCYVNNANRLDINNRERQNITRIRQVERQKGCR